jgi:Tfp pilus assembly protein PilO
VIAALTRLREELGTIGIASLGFLVLTMSFYVVTVRPLEERSRELDSRLESVARRSSTEGLKLVGANTQAAKIAAFYKYFDRNERIEDWLAKIYGIATASGLELRAGEYRLADSRQRIERYQVSLPVSGSYTQICAFMEAALAGIPVLSLDQASFRRKGTDESRVEAEIVLTLHLLRK